MQLTGQKRLIFYALNHNYTTPNFIFMQNGRFIIKMHLTPADMENLTGLDFAFISKFIPNDLKPNQWDEWSHSKKMDKLQRGTLIFDRDTVEQFIQVLCARVHEYHVIVERLRLVETQLGGVTRILSKMDKYLFNLNEFMSLSDLADELNYVNPKSLRNKLKAAGTEGDVPIAILELPGFKFKLYKVKNEWQLSRHDFQMQRQKLGLSKVIQYNHR